MNNPMQRMAMRWLGFLALLLIGRTAHGGWVAAGGTVTNYFQNGTNFTAHLFTNSGPFAVNSNLICDVLVVGGDRAGWGGHGGL